jgi:hypothetical protein
MLSLSELFANLSRVVSLLGCQVNEVSQSF